MMTGTSYLQFHMFDQLKDIEIKSVQVLDADYRIIKFEIRISGMTRVIITGKRIADHLLVDIMHQKSKYRKVLLLPVAINTSIVPRLDSSNCIY